MTKTKKPWIDSPPHAIASLGAALRGQGLTVHDANALDPGSTPSPSVARLLDASKKVVVRRENKGHGGKTVTIVEGLVLRPAELEKLARDLRKAFGCGSAVVASNVVLQGDVTDRLKPRLEQLGAKRVVVGN